MPLIRKPHATPQADPMVDAAGLLHTGLSDERWAAARSLTAPEDVAILSDALASETEVDVREAILSSLARIGTAESAGALIPYIRSDDANRRTGALDALLTMPLAALARLAALLADADPDVRLLACELARVTPGDEPAGLLCALLERDPEVNVCAAAIEVLAEVGGPGGLPALKRCAERFPDQPFLVFSVRIAIERISAQSAPPLA